MKDKRKLTEKEQKRIERLKVIEEELKKEGYEKTDLTVSTEKANALALITSAPFIIILVIFLQLFIIFYSVNIYPVNQISSFSLQ